MALAFDNLLADILYTHIAALVLLLELLVTIWLGGPGDQVSGEGDEFVGIAVQERVSVASPFYPDLKL